MFSPSPPILNVLSPVSCGVYGPLFSCGDHEDLPSMWIEPPLSTNVRVPKMHNTPTHVDLESRKTHANELMGDYSANRPNSASDGLNKSVLLERLDLLVVPRALELVDVLQKLFLYRIEAQRLKLCPQIFSFFETAGVK